MGSSAVTSWADDGRLALLVSRPIGRSTRHLRQPDNDAARALGEWSLVLIGVGGVHQHGTRPAAIDRERRDDSSVGTLSGFATVILRFTFLILAALLCRGASAESYICTVNGRTISSDRPPPQCNERELRVLNRDGSLLKIIPAPLTKEQREAKNAEEEEQRKAEEQNKAQQSKDRALLDAFKSIEDLEQARARTLHTAQYLVEHAKYMAEIYTKDRKRIEEEEEFYRNRPIPDSLNQALQDNRQLIEQQKRAKTEAEREMQQINQRFDSQKRRYIELMNTDR